MQKMLALVLASFIAVSFAAKEDCSYDVYGSEADDQVNNYLYCNTATHEKNTVTPAKITAHLKGKMYTCNVLEPDLTDEQLEAQLGIKLRPNFLGKFYQDSSNVWWMDLGQYGENCTYAQRATQVKYGVQFCAKGSGSIGYVHDMYFLSSNCSGLAAYASVPMNDLIANKFNTIQSDLFDPYPFLATMTGRNYVVKNKVLSKGYTVAPNAVAKDSYCYGVGQKFMPPVHLPTISTSGSVKTYFNQIYLPYNSQMCGISCVADVQAAIVAAGSNLATTPTKFANTTCGKGYGLMAGFNASFTTYGGITAGAYFFSSLILHYSAPRTCGVCQNDSTVMAMDPLATITTTLNAVNPAVPVVSVKSRMVYCQSDMIANNFVFQPEPDTAENPDDCGKTVVTTTSDASSFSVFSAMMFVVAFFVSRI